MDADRDSRLDDRDARGPREITMTYTTNETGAPRKATLTVTCGDETRTIGVEQEAAVPEPAAAGLRM